MVIIALLAVAGVSGAFIWNGKNSAASLTGASSSFADTSQNLKVAESIVDALRRHYVVPDGEKPAVSVVTDSDKVRKQNPFYKRAQNGDYVIVTSTRAILYSKTKDRILDIYPIEWNGGSSSSSSVMARTGAR